MVHLLLPVYWFFFTMSGAAVIVLRQRFPEVPRPFRVPDYPWVPLGSIATSLRMVNVNVAFVRIGTVFGIGILLGPAALLTGGQPPLPLGPAFTVGPPDQGAAGASPVIVSVTGVEITELSLTRNVKAPAFRVDFPATTMVRGGTS